MKKIPLIILVIAIFLSSNVVIASEYYEDYLDSDSILEQYKEDYIEIIEEYDDYKKGKIHSYNVYNLTYSYINRDIGILNHEWIIEEKEYEIQKKETELNIEYRNTYYNMYNLKNNVVEIYESYLDSKEEYDEKMDLYKQGYLSLDTLETYEYNNLKDYNNYISSKRLYENSLRLFNEQCGYDYNSSLTFEITEKTLKEIYIVDIYLDSALENDAKIIYYEKQKIKNEIKINYLKLYRLDYQSIKGSIDYTLTSFNMSIQTLENELYKDELKVKIRRDYNELLIEKDYIELLELNIKLKEAIKKDKAEQLTKGYISASEYKVYETDYDKQIDEYNKKIYQYNTSVYELEMNSSIFVIKEN